MHQVKTYPTATLGNRIAGARKVAGLTQKKFSERIDITRAAVAQWETGATAPSISMLSKAARILGVSPEWLAYGRVDPGFEATASHEIILMRPVKPCNPPGPVSLQ